nr:MAG TPA: hypothetical protein [Caudoviricetes sp.]
MDSSSLCGLNSTLKFSHGEEFAFGKDRTQRGKKRWL